jgi:hypothetical protein
MKPVIGVYVGWTPPHGETWEPLYRTMRCPGGYQSDRTVLYDQTLDRYPGLEEVTSFYPDSLRLPFALKRRTPLIRPDYERDAKTLNLPYPIPDLFEYIGRTGGLFSGDPFVICPIVEPNNDNNYSYESLLRKFEPEVRDSLNEDSPLKVILHNRKALITTMDDRVLGEMMPNFGALGEALFNIRIVRIGEKHYFGGGSVLIAFDTPVNLYSAPAFALTTPKEKVASV